MKRIRNIKIQIQILILLLLPISCSLDYQELKTAVLDNDIETIQKVSLENLYMKDENLDVDLMTFSVNIKRYKEAELLLSKFKEFDGDYTRIDYSRIIGKSLEDNQTNFLIDFLSLGIDINTEIAIKNNKFIVPTIFHVIKEQHSEVLNYIIDSKTDLLDVMVNGNSIEHLVARFSNYEDFSKTLNTTNRYEIVNEDGIPLIYIAATSKIDSLKKVKYLLSQNINTDFDGSNALIQSVIKENRDNAIAIISELDDFDANLNLKDENGMTPLFVAVWSGDYDIIQELLVRGADPHIQCNIDYPYMSGLFTPYEYAAEKIYIDAPSEAKREKDKEIRYLLYTYTKKE